MSGTFTVLDPPPLTVVLISLEISLKFIPPPAVFALSSANILAGSIDCIDLYAPSIFSERLPNPFGPSILFGIISPAVLGTNISSSPPSPTIYGSPSSTGPPRAFFGIGFGGLLTPTSLLVVSPIASLAPANLFNAVVVLPFAPSSNSRSAAFTLVSVAPFLVAPNAPSASLSNAGLTFSFKGLTILFIKALSTSPALAPRLTNAFVDASPCVPSPFLPAAAALASSSIRF